MPSLRTLGERMHLAFNQVGELLRGERLPVDEEQARNLLGALGATDPEAGRGVRLYKAALAERDQARRDAGQPDWWLRSGYADQVATSPRRNCWVDKTRWPSCTPGALPTARCTCGGRPGRGRASPR